MKYLIISLLLYIPIFANEMPKVLKGATVTITYADGRTEIVKSKHFKVVRRKKSSTRNKKIKYSVSGLVGMSRSKLKTIKSNSEYRSYLEYEPIFGLEYRVRYEKYFGQVSIFNNQTFIGGFGVEF